MRKNAIRGLCLMLALLLSLGTFVGCASHHNPLTTLKKNIIQNIDDSLGGELLEFLFDAITDGSVELSFGGTDLFEDLPDSLQLKLWTDAEDRSIAMKGTLGIAGATYEGSAWIKQNNAVISSPTFLGSTNLGVDFNTLREDLKTSIFANSSGTAFARPDVSEETATTVTEFKDAIFTLFSSTEEFADFADEVLECFLARLSENAYTNRYKQSGRTFVELSVNNDALSRSLRETRAALVGDRSFCRTLRKIAGAMDDLVASKDGVTTNKYATEVEYFLTGEEEIDRICLEIDNAAPFTFELKSAVRNFGTVLEDIECTYTVDATTRFEGKLHIAGREGVSTLSLDFGGVRRSFTYEITKDTFKAFSAKLGYERQGADGAVLVTNAVLETDRSTHTYVLGITQGEHTRSIGGTYALNESSFSLAVTSLKLDGETKKFDLSLSVSHDGNAPSVPSYVNLVKIDTTRFSPISERIGAERAKLAEQWATLELTPCSALSDLLALFDLEEDAPTPAPEAAGGEEF